MAKDTDILGEFSEPLRRIVVETWGNLTGAQRKELLDTLAQMPGSIKPLKDIVSLVADQYRPLVGARHKIAIVGPANVGKSTLYNQLIAHQQDRAQVSPIPGTTRSAQEADAGVFTVVDTPGADAAGGVGERERQIAFAAARDADFLVILFDATSGIQRHDKDLFDALAGLEKPYLVALNKIDVIGKPDRDAVRVAAAVNLHLEPAQVIAISALDGTNVGKVILTIARFEPRLLHAIGAAIPLYRARLAWQRVVPAAGSAAAVALLPLPLADMIPLFGIQTGLVLTIAGIYGFRITAGRARELIATFGVGFLARTLFEELSKLGGVPGWILSAAIASSTTAAIGYGAMIWFARGERPDRSAMKQIVSDITEYLKEQLNDLRVHRPDRGTLRERVIQALNDLPNRLRPMP